MTYQQKLIDVSCHNGSINWEKVKKAGYHAIIRCGYGQDYTDQDDAKFECNVKACESKNIPYGVYLYSYARDVENATSEAKHAMRLVEEHCGDMLKYPVFIDIEENKSMVQAQNIVNAFCSYVGDKGYITGVYSYASAFNGNLSYDEIKRKGWYVWVAHWASSCTDRCDMWQYTDKGSVPGILGSVDLNYSFVNFAEMEGDTVELGTNAKADVIEYLTFKTLCNEYGTGEQRKKELGDFYNDVQGKINELLIAK